MKPKKKRTKPKDRRSPAHQRLARSQIGGDGMDLERLLDLAVEDVVAGCRELGCLREDVHQMVESAFDMFEEHDDREEHDAINEDVDELMHTLDLVWDPTIRGDA